MQILNDLCEMTNEEFVERLTAMVPDAVCAQSRMIIEKDIFEQSAICFESLLREIYKTLIRLPDNSVTDELVDELKMTYVLYLYTTIAMRVVIND